MTPAISNDDLEQYCNSFFSEWKKDYAAHNYESCKQHSEKFIRDLKPVYKERLYGEGQNAIKGYTYIYLFLMLAKALEDVIALVGLTKDKTWPTDEKKTELIWQVLWDAKERMDTFNSHCFDQDILAGLYEQLERLEYHFYDVFGKGLYMSPVMLVKKAICSICELNIKACMHMPGSLYNGKYCKELVQDFEFKGADFVQSPHDMRCRVWPWNFTDEWHVTARIINLNQLDEFINE